MTANMVPAVAQVFSFATFITINTTIRPIKYPTAVIPRNCKALLSAPYTESKNCSLSASQLMLSLRNVSFTEKCHDTDCIQRNADNRCYRKQCPYYIRLYSVDPRHDLVNKSNSCHNTDDYT